MSTNPYDPPRTPRTASRHKAAVFGTLVMLTLPAVSIAGGATCAVTGNGLYRVLVASGEREAYLWGILPAVGVGVLAGSVIAALVLPRARRWIERSQID